MKVLVTGTTGFIDASKAARELGLPQNPVERALEDAVRWMRDHGKIQTE